MFALLVIAAVALYFMTGEERARLVRWIVVRLRLAQDGAHSLRTIMHEPLQDTLRQRTPWAVVTPALVGINIAVFAMMLMGPHSISDPDTLVAYGGNFGPRTTNGEWGRLITAIFVHRGVFDLLIKVVALVSVGLLLERLVGHLTFLAVYIGAGALASLVSLSTSLTEVSAGSSAAVFGLYGLLLASWAYGTVQQATTTVRLAAVRRMAPIAAVFVAYSLLTDHIDQAAESTGVVAGFVAGLVLGRYVRDGRPPARKVGMTMATAAAMVMVVAIPLRGVADVRPVLAQVLAVEEHAAREYDAAVKSFTKGRMNAKALAALIDEKVTPELEATRKQLESLQNVPPEHRPLVAAAETYLRMRKESWRLRVTALRYGNSALLRDAEQAERASLDALAMVRGGA